MAIYLFPFCFIVLLAVFSQFGLLRIGKVPYALVMLWVGLFAGIRFETGQDWPAYETYFNDIRDFDPFGSRFEVGYYLLNYLVKAVGGSYSAVLFVASLFCSFCVYRLTSRLQVNRFYVLAIYMGYSYLVLHFAQVRQSLALGFFILGIDSYLRRPRNGKLAACLLILISPLFQISSLMYVLLLAPVFMWQSRNPWWWVALLAMAGSSWVFFKFFDLAFLITLLANTSTQEKLTIYQELQTDQSIFQLLYAAYLMILGGYFYLEMRHVAPADAFVIRFAIVSLALTAFFAFALAGSYVFYSRAYAIGCLFQGLAAAIVFSRRKDSGLSQLVFVVSLSVACISFWRLLTFYSDQYTPYRTIFGNA